MPTADVVDRIVEQNLGVYRAAPSRLQEDVSQEAQVASDYRGRLVYELLQNADDAMVGQATQDDRVAFVVTDDALWMANSGRPLTDADVQGLCGLGASSKVDAVGTKRASIGHKGLGFKSVLEITDAPAVYSHHHAFELGAAVARPLIDELWHDLGQTTAPRAVPAMRFPAAIDDPMAVARWTELSERGFNTAFCFPFRDGLDGEQRTALTDRLVGLTLTTILFLKHLETVTVEIDQMGREEQREWSVAREHLDGDRWVPVPGFDRSGRFRVGVNSSDGESATFLVAHDADVEIGSNRVGLTGPAWDGVERTEVSVATLASDTPGEMPEEWRRFHVFLPTAEPSPYQVLVNGAFATDLSRQQVRVSDERGDYNAHLVRQAARLFVGELLPLLAAEDPGRVLDVLDRGDQPAAGEAATNLHRAMVTELTSVPLLPLEDGTLRELPFCVLPSPVLGDGGETFREVLGPDAGWDGRAFPQGPFCRGSRARVASDHGAMALPPAECVRVLGTADAQRSALREHESGYYEVDPVLELCAAIWERSEPDDRPAIEEAARHEAIFTVHRNDDGTAVREVLGDDTAFYPPQSATRDLPLGGLRFLAHAVCWGALNRNERSSMLGDRTRTWSALFDLKEFRFQEVMQASVLPALILDPTDEQVRLRDSLQSDETLAAICQLAGAFTKPDRPLRYQRLGTDRAIFNLSRLPVPCVASDGTEVWVPAYRAYFGTAWSGEDSVEHVVAGLPAGDPARDEIELHVLAGPERFLGLLGEPDEISTADGAEDQTTDAGDEVDLDEDVDRGLDATERDRWFSFFAWIGVNPCLRLVHFHDVEDRDSGWLTTKELEQPQGWAFRRLGETWTSFAEQLTGLVAARDDVDKVVPYLYEIHDLEYAGPLIGAAERDVTSEVARRLFAHLVRHWHTYSAFADAGLALVEKGKWPNSRNKPQTAQGDELESLGDNLWLHRLRWSGVCPTTRGPRRPGVTWLRTPELERRFTSSRGKRDCGDLVAVLDVGDGLSASGIRALAERLGVRGEPSPSNFDPVDARLLCEQLRRLHAGDPGDAFTLRHVVKPAYRSMFELLSGHAEGSTRPTLGDVPLLARAGETYRFLPARDVLFVRTSGLKERSGLVDVVDTFVLEAEPAAESALVRIFGCRVLDDALEWRPRPGECPLDDAELSEVRAGLRSLAPALLARVRTQRTRDRDRDDLLDLLERIELVEALDLTCALDGRELGEASTRGYHVRPRAGGNPFQGFIVWDEESSWPPSSATAQRLAMAIADTLGVNLVETFLAFLTASESQRHELLEIAGASALYDEVLAELDEEPAGDDLGAQPADVASAVRAEPTAAPEADHVRDDETPLAPGAPSPAAPPVPLHDFGDLLLDGEPILVTGERSSAPEGSSSAGSSGGPSSSPRGSDGQSSPRAAAGTDLDALDALGMRIAVAYERRRLTTGGAAAAIVGGELHGVGDSLVVEVHTPRAVQRAEELSDAVKSAMAELEAAGISRVHPGFDLLSIRDGRIDRLIELKSSGVDARVQAMSWNEWKSAAHSELRDHFWLYLAGNLRADIDGRPYLRAIHDPFGTLMGRTVEDHQVRRAVQLRVREFETAEHLDLTVKDRCG